MRDFIVYDGKNLSDFQVYISNAGVYAFPERSIEKKNIPGKNGAVIFENDVYENVKVTYPAIVMKDFDSNVDALLSYLLSKKGYVRIEDTFRRDYFRMGTFTDPDKAKITMDSKAGTLELTFDCKPQLYLKSGEESHTLTSSTVMMNPTYMEAKPLIRAYGTGSIGVGSKVIHITSVDEYVDIDCEIMDAYKGNTNCNANIYGSFPVLTAGSNTIVLNGVNKIDIIPRFWTL